MKLLVQSAMIFFGTLMAAGLVALGEPVARGGQDAAKNASLQVLNQFIEATRPKAGMTPAAVDRTLTGWHE